MPRSLARRSSRNQPRFGRVDLQEISTRDMGICLNYQKEDFTRLRSKVFRPSVSSHQPENMNTYLDDVQEFWNRAD